MELHKEEKLWACPRCKTNDITDGSSGCPRGGCEAKVIGRVVTGYELLPGESLEDYKEDD